MKHMLSVLTLAAATALAAPAAGPGVLKQFSTELADTVEKIMPSVVVVRTEAVRYHRAYDLFFGRRLTIPERLAGQGSGVFIDAEGHVLTSRHVVAGAEQVEVVMSDETALTAEVVGMDANTDLAVLKVKKPAGLKITPVAMGNSDVLRIGEFVIAVGSPFSLSSSVTLGVVSQKGRSVGILPFEDFIQTDAPINPGNSGGPLVDIEGRLIGINAVIQTSGYSQGSIGIGFAVPVNLARRVADSIIRTGTFERPWIGIAPAEGSRRPGREGKEADGLMIGGVFGNTPAAKAGLREGDVIARADGQPVNSIQDLQRVILSRKLGEKILFIVSRDSRRIELSIPTEAMPAFDEE